MAEIFGTTGNNLLFGTPEDDVIDVLEGNDAVVSAGDGKDTVFGGLGEIDELTGNEGSDVFELGQISPTGTQDVFYNDGDVATAGTNDYALITDFGTEEDKIKLVGEIGDYSLAASPDDFPSGTAIYLNDGATPELIAIVKNIDPSTLDLHNPEQFQASSPIPEISVFSEPDTPLSELESTPGRFILTMENHQDLKLKYCDRTTSELKLACSTLSKKRIVH